eukprot:NODE_4716_length_751_cov_3.932692_g4556_i0.p1 GENE.NODE_4716_length_751_cov_3.932692_g4556_i0~~NODE_4716_length_751_cov_3.932692_g4556_i0.p1  ORF type:complete len:231 (-),score=67.95 NODE_4716_length_751_cov_3.932692_g4556_i0:58-705(-)
MSAVEISIGNHSWKLAAQFKGHFPFVSNFGSEVTLYDATDKVMLPCDSDGNVSVTAGHKHQLLSRAALTSQYTATATGAVKTEKPKRIGPISGFNLFVREMIGKKHLDMKASVEKWHAASEKTKNEWNARAKASNVERMSQEEGDGVSVANSPKPQPSEAKTPKKAHKRAPEAPVSTSARKATEAPNLKKAKPQAPTLKKFQDDSEDEVKDVDSD